MTSDPITLALNSTIDRPEQTEAVDWTAIGIALSVAAAWGVIIAQLLRWRLT